MSGVLPGRYIAMWKDSLGLVRAWGCAQTEEEASDEALRRLKIYDARTLLVGPFDKVVIVDVGQGACLRFERDKAKEVKDL